jgi:DNA-binding LytR/AlgR family response regulator
MTTVFVVAGEPPVQTELTALLREIDEKLHIVAQAATVKDGARWLNENPSPDLMLMDTHLNDGLAFELFEHSNVRAPVIYLSRCDEYMKDAFAHFGIDYVVKPIGLPEMRRALGKFQDLFAKGGTQKLPPSNHFRTRLVVKNESEYLTLKLTDAAYFTTEHKQVYVVTAQGQRYLVNKNLGELEEELDPSLFFRANRQCIVHINYIRKFRSFEKSKLALELAVSGHEDIIISQETAASFREWINNV